MKWFPPLLLAAIFVALCGCGKRSPKGLTIAVIPKGTSHEFWKSIHAGARKAEMELTNSGVAMQIIWKGPLLEDDRDQQIGLVETFTVRRVSGMVLAPLDSRALVAPVESAMAASIPVVIIDSALQSQQPISYVATDNYRGGQLGAECLGELLKGEGKVILLRYQEGSASTEQREAGFLDALTNRFPKIQLLSTKQYSGATRELAYEAAQNLLQLHGREVSGFFAPCEPVTIGVHLALKEAQKAGGKVKLVGFDASAAAVQALQEGDIQGLVIQDPVKMGYLGVKTMVDHLQGKPVPRVIDTGVRLVTRATMHEPAVQELLNPPLDKYLK